MSMRIASLPAERVAQTYRSNSLSQTKARSDARAWERKRSPAKSDSVHLSKEALEQSRLYWTRLAEEANREKRAREERDEQLRRSLAILELGARASFESIKKAYYDLMKHYHPDKYAHLPPEFRELAEARTKQIISAYKTLTEQAPL